LLAHAIDESCLEDIVRLNQIAHYGQVL
jgi:hypothetical protein